MKKKLALSSGILLLIVIGCVVFFLYNKPQNQPTLPAKKNHVDKSSKEVKDESKQLPTIFVHGYSGGKGSFGGMIRRFSKNNEASKSLVATIQGNGTITYEGDYQTKQKNPMIQVLFVENKSTEENQSLWIKELLTSLKENYGIRELNAVGHSMGGVSLVNYLVNNGSNSELPTIKKLVLIGAPLNGLEIGDDGVTEFDLTPEGPKTSTERYQNFMNLRENIPTDLSVLSIAGDKENGTKSDGAVSVASAQSAKFIFDGQVTDYREMTFTGLKAAHSLLHENAAVDEAVAAFLWNDK